MVAEAKLVDRLTRHQLYVQSFGGGQVKKALPVLRQLARDLRRRIAGSDATDFQMGRMMTLERDIQEIVSQAAAGIQARLDLDDFATQEVQFTQRLMGAAVAVDLGEGIAPETIRAIVSQRRMNLVAGDAVKRLTIREAFNELAGNAGLEAMRVVQAGVIEGRTQQQMAREVAGLIETRTRRQAETVIRTATNHIGNIARDEVYAANSDILDGEKWLSTLDGATTLLCQGRDGRVYPVGSGPRPPGHYGCRSVMLPIVKPEYRIAAQGERASMDGPVDNRTTYGGWLKKQPADFQDDVLGPERAKLFRSGKVSIDKFTDDMGRTLSLDELAAREGLTLS